ncbi:hypothetical protein [Paenibacillus oryzisoli]|uniref:Type 4 fimbrial biogenesis protein PilX N-terminal domain-containing protein n=1 Tax=Paenibacillus oryzisoli TaxID=1850517 RepID=A0A197ZY29_9BACL|nr:hypothetical protein [Paenibacillus oryzisoli]OAS13900.1 hypothetical protein A8708_10995 [Paenibacillus oryzisoli]
MNRWKDEQGAALLIVLFMIIVFTMLGMAVLSASLGGAIRTETKQRDVQSLHLAEKALNEAVAILKANLDGEDISPDAISYQIRDEILPIINGNIMETDYQEKPVINASVSGNPPVVLVEATATVNGVKRTLKQQITINTYPDMLNYAAGSEGNLILNGSPYFLNGDLYAGDKLKIKNEANYLYNDPNEKSESTKFPVLNGRAFVQSFDKFTYCDGKNGTIDCTNNYMSISHTSDSGVTTIPVILNTEKDNVQFKSKESFVQLNMDESFIDKVTEALHGDSALRTLVQRKYYESIPNLITYIDDSLPEPQKLPSLPLNPEVDDVKNYNTRLQTFIDTINTFELGGITVLYKGNFNMGIGGTFSQLIYTPDAKGSRTGHLSNAAPCLETYCNSNWFIIDGDLNIEPTADNSPIKIRGNILVTGNVNIQGNVDIDATIFSLSNYQATSSDSKAGVVPLKITTGVEISDASIKGLNNKELLLMSKGKILITRVNSFKPLPSSGYPSTSDDITRLDAFFYTEDDAELYGVGSVFWIKGGFFARGDLTINALRGNTEPDINSKIVALGQTNDEKFSRFIIDYKQDIFTNQNVGLPRVRGINLKTSKKVQTH